MTAGKNHILFLKPFPPHLRQRHIPDPLHTLQLAKSTSRPKTSRFLFCWNSAASVTWSTATVKAKTFMTFESSRRIEESKTIACPHVKNVMEKPRKWTLKIHHFLDLAVTEIRSLRDTMRVPEPWQAKHVAPPFPRHTSQVTASPYIQAGCLSRTYPRKERECSTGTCLSQHHCFVTIKAGVNFEKFQGILQARPILSTGHCWDSDCGNFFTFICPLIIQQPCLLSEHDEVANLQANQDGRCNGSYDCACNNEVLWRNCWAGSSIHLQRRIMPWNQMPCKRDEASCYVA